MISGYGVGILLVSSDVKPKTMSPATQSQKFRKTQTEFKSLVLNVAGPIPSLTRRVKTFHNLPQKLKEKKN